MIEIREVDVNNIESILNLKVDNKQKHFLASNERSIIEAYIAIISGGYAFTFGIYSDDVIVGFMMIGFDDTGYFDNPPAICYGNYSLVRLMIDKKYQNMGYGKQALKLGIDFVKSMLCGKAKYLWLSHQPDNIIARDMYYSVGFKPIDEKDGKQNIVVLEL